MKKIKPILITFLVLAGVTAGGYYFLTNQQKGPSGEIQNRIKEEQTDLGVDRAYRYDMGRSATVLETAGENKNVLNFQNKEIYRVTQSNADRERLNRLIKRSDADLQNPIIALNPFGTNENSFYFYFTTSYRCMIRYTITVEDESIPDHIRYVNNGRENNLATQHEFVVSGLVPGKTNYIIIEQLDTNGSKREEKIYQYTAPTGDAPIRIPVDQGYSKDTSKEGLFFVFPNEKKEILAYDNQGVLRNVTKTEGAHGKRIYQSEDSVLYQVTDNKIARVSSLGRVLQTVEITGYGSLDDFSYDGFDEVYAIAKKKNRSYLLAASMNTGKQRVVYQFPKGVSAGSLSTPKGGQVLLTASDPSGVICLDAITSTRPRILFVMGQKSQWNKKINKKKVLQDKEAASWDTQDSQLASVTEDTVSLLVGKKGKAAALYGKMDTKKKKWNTLTVREVGGSTANTIQIRRDHLILTDMVEGNFAEYDADGKVTRLFHYGSPVEAVVKLTLGGMCFYGI